MIISIRAKLLILCAAVLLSLQAVLCQGHLKIYYVRHGESGRNVVKEWINTPKEQWPSYVGNADVFTPKGEVQVEKLTERLKGMKFDFIAASPLWRTRHTILPYLKAMNAKAEIWPELIETGKFPDTCIHSQYLPAPSRALFAGDSILLSQEEAPYFILSDSARTSPLRVSDFPQAAADAIALGKHVVQDIRNRFAGTDQSILLVGHGNSGKTLLRLLTGGDYDESLGNTKMWMAQEQSDGTFALKMLNDKLIEELMESK